jgi:hypothetical protein
VTSDDDELAVGQQQSQTISKLSRPNIHSLSWDADERRRRAMPVFDFRRSRMWPLLRSEQFLAVGRQRDDVGRPSLCSGSDRDEARLLHERPGRGVQRSLLHTSDRSEQKIAGRYRFHTPQTSG